MNLKEMNTFLDVAFRNKNSNPEDKGDPRMKRNMIR